MAHLIAPPSSVQPMTREDVAVVQAEKRVDAATREQLVKVYGDSRDPHSRRIALTRPSNRGWRCPACRKHSTDIRHVCEFCVAPESGFTATTAASARQATTAAPLTPVQRPGTTRDTGVRLLQTPVTRRTYRVFTEPHVIAGKSKAVAARSAVGNAPPTAATATTPTATAMAGTEGGDEEEGEWDDEPDCGAAGNAGTGSDGSGGEEEEEEAASGAAPASQSRPPTKTTTTADGGAFTHFMSIAIGKIPTVSTNAASVVEDVRSFVAATHDAAAKRGGSTDATTAAAGSSPAASAKSPSVATAEMVTSASKLHMTLLMLSLPRREDVELAKQLLHRTFAPAWAATKETWASAKTAGYALSRDASLAPAHRHPLMRLGGGLQVMKGGRQNELYEPEKASVVYMGIDDPASLATVQELQRVLHESLAELITDPAEAARSRRVLHATVMNKKWRKGRGARPTFDARTIVDTFQQVSIGAGEDSRQLFEVTEIELCSMRRQDPESGTYAVDATVGV